MRDRYARTLQEAFGPYTSNRIEDPDEPARRRRNLVAAGVSAALAVIAAAWLTFGG